MIRFIHLFEKINISCRFCIYVCIAVLVLCALLLMYNMYNSLLCTDMNKLLVVKYNNLKVLFQFRLLILTLSLITLLLWHDNNVWLGISASAVVWSIVEFFDKIINTCTIFENEKNEFYSFVTDNITTMSQLLHHNYEKLNFTEIDKALSMNYADIANFQTKSEIFVLGDEFLAVNNYFACLKEMVKDFSKERQEDVYNLLIIKKEVNDNFSNIKDVLVKPEPYDFTKPVFSKDKLYKFHNIEKSNEGDILHSVSVSFPDSRCSETKLTFKPMYELNQFILSNKTNNIVEVVKILLIKNWFKNI